MWSLKLFKVYEILRVATFDIICVSKFATNCVDYSLPTPFRYSICLLLSNGQFYIAKTLNIWINFFEKIKLWTPHVPFWYHLNLFSPWISLHLVPYLWVFCYFLVVFIPWLQLLKLLPYVPDLSPSLALNLQWWLVVQEGEELVAIANHCPYTRTFDISKLNFWSYYLLNNLLGEIWFTLTFWMFVGYENYFSI